MLGSMNPLLVLRVLTCFTACLQSLAFPEMRERGNDIANAASNTCTWLSEDPRYLEWSSQRHGLLWIKGHPGVGKSTLMKHAAEGLSSRGDTIFASFFFYGGGSLMQKSALGLFRSLLHQIIQQLHPLLQELTLEFTKRCENDGEYGRKWTWHERQLQSFFESSVVEAAKINTIRIFVDALDECGEKTATSLVTFFEGIAGHLSICFSCRHYPLIALENGLEVCVEDKNAQDIATFVCHELKGEGYDLVRDQITRSSAGNFQWANLVVSIVLSLVRRGIPPRAIQRKIQQSPQELSKLYEELLKSIPDDDIQESLHLMQWIYFGLRPLSLGELRFAMAMDASPSSTSVSQCQEAENYVETNEAMERRVRDLSKGLAEPVNHGGEMVVQFIHQSVIDFLRTGGLQLLDRSQEGATADTLAGRSHFRLSKTCIRYLAMEEMKQRYDLIKMRMKMRSPPVPPLYPLEDYSITYWIRHVVLCEENDLSAVQLLSYYESLGLLDVYDQHSKGSHNYPPKSEWPITLLHVASRYNLPRALDALLSLGGKADPEDGNGRTPLSWAIEEGHETIVRMLIERGNVNPDSVGECGRTPLSRAAQGGHKTIVRTLLERDNVNPDSVDTFGRTPLSWAAERGWGFTTKMLLERDDVNPDSVDLDGRTPLSWAAERGQGFTAKLLLERSNVNPNSVDRYRETPLLYAVRWDREPVVTWLLERNDVDVNCKDENGDSPLIIAAFFNVNEEIIRLLLSRDDVDVNVKGRWGRTLLSYAAYFGRKSIVRMLLWRDDIDVNLKSDDGRTALDYALEEGHEAIVRLLQQHSH